MSNISRKEEKAKLFSLNKQAFVQDLLELRPKDYAERNWFYQRASILLSYPLQAISVLAGSYLLFQMAYFLWGVDLQDLQGMGVFAFCISIFLGIEALRRWLVNTTGHHYVATFRTQKGKLHAGEWLGTKRIWLLIISGILVSTGTIGIYQYIKNNRPEVATVDMKTVTSPLEAKIGQEKKQIASLDAEKQQILLAKSTELKDKRSYVEWNGKELLLPEVKERHKNYDKQLQALYTQREKHLALVAQYEQKLTQKENHTEDQNQAAISSNNLNTELYAGIGAGIWLGFEMLLVFMLSYTWLYKYGVKREQLLQGVENKKKHKTTVNQVTAKQEQTQEIPVFYHKEFIAHVKNRKIPVPEDRVQEGQLEEIIDGFPNPLNQKLWNKLLNRVEYAELQNKQVRLDKLEEENNKFNNHNNEEREMRL